MGASNERKDSSGCRSCFRFVSSKLALMSIHAIAFKYKHKQVRNAAKEALSLAAKTRGITEEELEDQLVPDLGFTIQGEKIIDFGNRSFTAILTTESKLN